MCFTHFYAFACCSSVVQLAHCYVCSHCLTAEVNSYPFGSSERSWNCLSCVGTPFLVSKGHCTGLSQEVPWEALPLGLLSHQELQSVCARWSSGFLTHSPLKQTVTLVSDAMSSDLETHWTKNVYNLFFPLDSLSLSLFFLY